MTFHFPKSPRLESFFVLVHLGWNLEPQVDDFNWQHLDQHYWSPLTGPVPFLSCFENNGRKSYLKNKETTFNQYKMQVVRSSLIKSKHPNPIDYQLLPIFIIGCNFLNFCEFECKKNALPQSMEAVVFECRDKF